MHSGNLKPGLILLSILILLTITSYLFVYAESGVNPPVTVVESQSMQHSNQSEIGVIDTGDMIVVRSPDRTTIVSYVEGYSSDYSSFGDYGSVIIYNRLVGNPVIHRAILWLEYNGDGTWSAPALADYPEEKWSLKDYSTEDTSDEHDYNYMTGTLVFTIDYKAGYSKTVTINLSKLEKTSGYLTMGDNLQNNYFDQQSIWANHLIGTDDIRSVAWIEMPWYGSIRLYFQGNADILNEWASNSIPNLVTQTFVVLITIAAIGFAMDEIILLHMKRKLRNLRNAKMNSA